MCNRRYYWELGLTTAAYVVMLFGSILLVNSGMVTGRSRTVIVLLPMLPACATCWVIVRQLRRMDEFQLRLQLEALAIAFVGTALITFSYGFLEGIGYSHLSMFFVWGIMGILWSAGHALARWSYR